MEKKLNIEKLESAMTEKGFNQAALAKSLEVSRTIISEWLKGTKFPRPDKLLKLGMALGLSFSDLVIKSTQNEPVVAFRKKGGRKTKDHHFERAKDMGYLLEGLAAHLPFSSLTNPPSLKDARLEYNYIQEVATNIRGEIGAKSDAPIGFKDLIQVFKKFDVVLVPALWGRKENHGNALHIHLPSSGTTWIYLNLDSNFHDFNFWIAHELGHVLSQRFDGDEAEDFSDAFAQALLFPRECASEVYRSVKALANTGIRIKKVLEVADNYNISPITVYEAINSYASENGKPRINLSNSFYGATTNFNKGYLNVSDALGEKKKLTAKSYIELTRELFDSPFFEAMGRYLSENKKSPGFIQNVLQVDFVDAKGIYKELLS